MIMYGDKTEGGLLEHKQGFTTIHVWLNKGLRLQYMITIDNTVTDEDILRSAERLADIIGLLLSGRGEGGA